MSSLKRIAVRRMPFYYIDTVAKITTSCFFLSSERCEMAYLAGTALAMGISIIFGVICGRPSGRA
jgi:hypothetical protein